MMDRHILMAPAVCVLLAACSGVPDFPPASVVKASDVTTLVECQLYEALRDQTEKKGGDWLRHWAVGASLAIQRQSVGAAAAGLDWTIPAAGLQKLGLSPSASASNSRLRKGEIEFSFLAQSLLANDAKTRKTMEELCSPAKRAERGASVFHGGIGISEWLDQVVAAVNEKDIVGKPKTFGQTVEFALKLRAGVRPTLEIVNLSANGELSVEITDTYTLGLAFTYVDPNDYAYPPVWVVNQPYHHPVRPPYADGRPSPDRSPGARVQQSDRQPRPRPLAPRRSPDVPPAAQQRLDRQLYNLRVPPLSTQTFRPF